MKNFKICSNFSQDISNKLKIFIKFIKKFYKNFFLYLEVVLIISETRRIISTRLKFFYQGMSTSVCKPEWGMRDWDKPKWMPKSGLFGVRLVKSMSSIANIFFFEVPTPNG